MPGSEDVQVDVREIALQRADGASVHLGELSGVQLVVLMRHRH